MIIMSRLLFIVFVVAAGPVGFIRHGEADEARRPNVLVIYTDDQDNSEVACYGGDVSTPHLDRLAAEGMRFTRYYPSSPLCTPSRYSVLTGRYASRSPWLQAYYPVTAPPVIRWNTSFVPGETTIATLLKEQGYATGMVGKWHNGLPLLETVSPSADPRDPQIAARIRENYRRVQDRIRQTAGFDYVESIYGDNLLWLPLPTSLQYHNQEWVTHGAIRFIEQNAARPFFLYVSTTIPHGPGALASLKADPRMTPAGILDEAPDVQPSRSDVLRRAEQAGYRKDDYRKSGWAGIAWLDDGVGALLAKLDELGLADNTLVIFASDHARRGKMTCYAGPVPCIVRWNGHVQAGVVCDELISNIDVVPTVLKACRVPPPREPVIDGRSWLPLLRDPETAWRDSLFLEITSTRGVVTKNWNYVAIRYAPGIQALITPTNRREFNQEGSLYAEGSPHHVRYKADQLFPGYYDDDQLYDLTEDSKQQHNLAGDPQHAGVLQEMKRRMRDYCLKLPHEFGEFTSPASGTAPGDGAHAPRRLKSTPATSQPTAGHTHSPSPPRSASATF